MVREIPERHGRSFQFDRELCPLAGAEEILPGHQGPQEAHRERRQELDKQRHAGGAAVACFN
jgi:hypothetical protein